MKKKPKPLKTSKNLSNRLIELEEREQAHTKKERLLAKEFRKLLEPEEAKE